MITLMVMPNFKGNAKETFTASLICLVLDSIYIVPLLLTN